MLFLQKNFDRKKWMPSLVATLVLVLVIGEKKGGSSINANNMANYQSNYSSTHGCNQFTYDDNGENYWPEALHA